MNEHDLLDRLARLPGGFTAAQVARKGWAGLRTKDAAAATLESLASVGKLQRLTPNRQGQARYAFTLEEPEGERIHWSSWDAGFIGIEDLMLEGEDGAPSEPAFSVTTIPQGDAAEVDLQRMGLELARQRVTRLHFIAASVRARLAKPLTQVQEAWVLALAQERLNPDFAPLPSGKRLGGIGGSVEQSNDPRLTHLRGVARHLRMRYQFLLEAVRIAEEEIRAATGEPTMCVGMKEKRKAA